jgi:hypothetical protein
MLGSRTRSVLSVFVSAAVLGSCMVPSEPGGKGSFGVIASPIEGGWSILVPVCSGDVISSLSLTSDGGSGGVNPEEQVEYRWADVENRQERLVELIVTRATVENGALNPTEVREVSSVGRLDIGRSMLWVTKGDETDSFGGPLEAAASGPTLLADDKASPFTASPASLLATTCAQS